MLKTREPELSYYWEIYDCDFILSTRFLPLDLSIVPHTILIVCRSDSVRETRAGPKKMAMRETRP